MFDHPSREHVRTLVEALGGKTPTWDEKHEAFLDFRTNLRWGAQISETHGKNWRPNKPVKVGCCVLGHDGRGNFDTKSMGWNNTPRPLSEEEKQHFKPCAEKFGILRCLKRRLIPVGMVLYTTHNQRDDVTGLCRELFCCCSNCAVWMKEICLPDDFMIEVIRLEAGVDPGKPGPYVNDTYNLGMLIGMHEEALKQKSLDL